MMPILPSDFQEQDLKAILKTDAGQQLLKLLNKDGGAALKQAAKAIQAGQYQKAYDTMAPLMKEETAVNLIEQINRQRNG